ncbi:MAG: hypothetical protein GY838_13895 [bacterium]|nr:hypothetical protein [bacterium]
MRVAIVGLVLLGLVTGSARAESRRGGAREAATAGTWWLATGLGAGAVSPDQGLADYRWNTNPTALYAVQASVGRGRFALGLRLSRWGTSQGTGLSQDEPDPAVNLTAVDLVGQLRVVEFAGFQLWGSGLIGRVNLSYTPDRLTVDTGTPGQELTVNYETINETDLGLGLEIKRGFGRRLTTAVLAERTVFHLDTRHRRGREIVSERQEFANWSLRLQVSWVLDLG